jgi:ribonuclease P protein component
VDRIVHKADFERVLATRSRSRSAHFALHHLPAGPTQRIWPMQGQPKGPQKDPLIPMLSTALAPNCPQAVDDSAVQDASKVEETPDGAWIACVVPKRHARRAVTRNLLKRQVRSAFQRLGDRLPAGLWLVRLRAPFAKQDFASARSVALALAARTELDGLLQRALV